MVREIQRLQRRNEDLEEEKDTLGEKNSWIEQIMSSLKDNGLGKAIINRLKRGESHQSIAEWLGRPLVGSGDAQELSPTTERSVSQAIEQYYQRLVDNRDPRYWTNVTQDTQLIEHLMTLYFTWIHPVHMLFDERRFMASLRHCSEEHCSSALVSVICAVSCHLLHNIDNDDDQMNAAVDSLRNQFMEATRNMMKDADDGRMTTVQTHAVMYLAEFGTGHGLIAASHLRLAVETLIEKQNSEQAEESERVAVWGILSLHT